MHNIIYILIIIPTANILVIINIMHMLWMVMVWNVMRHALHTQCQIVHHHRIEILLLRIILPLIILPLHA